MTFNAQWLSLNMDINVLAVMCFYTGYEWRFREKAVTPVKTGVQCSCNYLKYMDTGFRRYDKIEVFVTFYESANIK